MTAMTHQTSKLFATRRQRAASLRQVWSQRIRALARGLWAALEAAGQRRAAPYLLREAARQQATNPALAAELHRMACCYSSPTRATTPAQAHPKP
jgi:hypothetical protein